ncbi:unnamed protein product [Gongylonema pulchrum]|uniref:Rx_N domain-containing protein n=1 Tax=Gongylonema pulchrum TaxID=637853 RepID=A0A183DGX0_9BILA|nr:unnamed protein product [Gongylonema pulchrum]
MQKAPVKVEVSGREQVSPEKLLQTRALTATEVGSQPLEYNQLQKWLILARDVLSTVIKDLDGLEQTMDRAMVCVGTSFRDIKYNRVLLRRFVHK